MATVEVVRETPAPPPISEVIVTLTEQEARDLRQLLYKAANRGWRERGRLNGLENALTEANFVPDVPDNSF
jgi:hypothetical protein